MRSTPIDSATKHTAMSRLGRSLIRIHKEKDHSIVETAQADVLFSTWQQKWASRREEIARRLEMIESQLADLTESDEPRPQLSLVGSAEDTLC